MAGLENGLNQPTAFRITLWISVDFKEISSNFDGLNFKWTYLGAQEELVGQTVIAT